jgi:hypothetical protein
VTAVLLERPLPIGRLIARDLGVFKQRYVRTPAGARRYGVPIGSPIPIGRKVKTPAEKPSGRKQRYVRSEAGAKRYGVPVGDPIPLGRKVKDPSLSAATPAATSSEAVSKVHGDYGGARDGDTIPELATVRDAWADVINADNMNPDMGDGFVPMTKLRPALAARGITDRSEQDRILAEAAATIGLVMTADPDRGARTPAERDAAVNVGGDERDYLLVEPREDFDQ